MAQLNACPAYHHCNPQGRRAAVLLYVTISLAAVLGFAALAVDVGMLYATRAEIQRTADAAALSAAWELLDEERLKGGPYLEHVLEAARDTAVSTAATNTVLRAEPIVDRLEDVELGYLADPYDRESEMTSDSPELTNAAALQVRRDSERGGSIALYFARFLGTGSRNMGAQATAAFADGTVGFEVTESSGNAQLLPFALHVDPWSGLLAGTETTGDDYSYDQETGTVSPGSDGIFELNLYPGAGCEQLPPGNFGTVDIGASNNSTADIARQILEGVSAEDLAHLGGSLVLGPNGTLELNGDTGLSAGVKDELEAIKGQPRAIPLFSQVSGPGNNAVYTVVGFAGIRIMNVKLTGPMRHKRLIIQPAFVVDDAVVAEPGPGPSYYVYRPVQLVR